MTSNSLVKKMDKARQTVREFVGQVIGCVEDAACGIPAVREWMRMQKYFLESQRNESNSEKSTEESSPFSKNVFPPSPRISPSVIRVKQSRAFSAKELEEEEFYDRVFVNHRARETIVMQKKKTRTRHTAGKLFESAPKGILVTDNPIDTANWFDERKQAIFVEDGFLFTNSLWDFARINGFRSAPFYDHHAIDLIAFCSRGDVLLFQTGSSSSNKQFCLPACIEDVLLNPNVLKLFASGILGDANAFRLWLCLQASRPALRSADGEEAIVRFRWVDFSLGGSVQKSAARFGVRFEKDVEKTFSRWSKLILEQPQILYAAQDVLLMEQLFGVWKAEAQQNTQILGDAYFEKEMMSSFLGTMDCLCENDEMD